MTLQQRAAFRLRSVARKYREGGDSASAAQAEQAAGDAENAATPEEALEIEVIFYHTHPGHPLPDPAPGDDLPDDGE